MRLYLKECRRISFSSIYILFAAVLVFSWFQNFCGVTTKEIAWAHGIEPETIGFDRPLLVEPTESDEYFGNKASEDDPAMIMAGTTRALIDEYENNSYATYPLGYYKAITLNDEKQDQVLQIICEITGLTEEQLKNLPQDYFPAVTGTIISFDSTVKPDESGNITIENNAEAESSKFVPQVNYGYFKKLMTKMEKIIGENGSQYSPEMMKTYFGLSQMSYDEAHEEYIQTIQDDKVTGGFARLFCDYMGLALGLYPIFIIVIMWLKDRTSNVTELMYSKKVSSVKLVLSRYFAGITMILIPVFLLSMQSLIPLMMFGAKNGIDVDCFAYVKYILWWLLPTVMIVSAIGIFFTLLTDSPAAVIFQFLWWMIDKGVTSLSGGTNITTLMIRHNTLRGYQIIQKDFNTICINRVLIAGISVILVGVSIWLLEQKRKGKINAANIYVKCLENIKYKLPFSNTK